jgi:hypothetical protein
MEAALGADFTGVRVHVGPQAERLGAIAFTMGNEIYFSPGRFQPDTMPGRRLLGHELAHVVQQRQGRVRNPTASALTVVQDQMLEGEAERWAHRVASIPVPSGQPKMVQRSAARPAAFHSTPLLRARGGLSIQLSPMSKVMGANETFHHTQHELLPHWVLRNDRTGWERIPAGYHVTIFPNLTDQQKTAVLTGNTREDIEKLGSLEFTQFNVTKGHHGKHFYFNEEGVYWAGKNKEAGLNDEGWEDAIDAALCVYVKIEVATSKETLFGQLYSRGRMARNTNYEQEIKDEKSKKSLEYIENMRKQSGSTAGKKNTMLKPRAVVRQGTKILNPPTSFNRDPYPSPNLKKQPQNKMDISAADELISSQGDL